MTPNTITWLQILSDAIKIGLGALIAGFFAWLVARHNANSTIQKFTFERRSKILSEAAQSFEAIFQVFLKYSSHLKGIEQANRTDVSMLGGDDIKMQFIQQELANALKMRVQLMEAMQQTFSAQSQLMLLGEERCRESAASLLNSILAADEAYSFNGSSFNLEQFEKTSEAVRVARIAFYREMQTAFTPSQI